MKLAEYQELEAAAYSRHATAKEKAERQAALAARLKSDPVSGTIYVPVFFGSAKASKGEAVDTIAATLQISKREAKAVLKESTVEGGYTRLEVAHAVGMDWVGMGSITNYRIAEADPEAAHDASVSETKGTGWHLIS